MEKNIIKICEQKIRGDLNLSWEDLAEKFNFKNGEMLRQQFKAYRKRIGTLPSKTEHITKELELKLSELDKKTMEMEKEKIKLQRTKLDIKRWLRNQAKFDLMVEHIENAIVNLEPINVPKLNIRPSGKKTAIIGLADIHYGKRILIRGLYDEIINRYDADIFEDRMWELYHEIVRISNKEELDEVHIVNLADAVDGLLHIKQLQEAEFGVIDSVMKLSEFLAIWLNELSKHVFVNYHSTLGNHPEVRPLNTKAGELDKENMERIIHEFIRLRLSNNQNINIHACDKVSFMNIFGLNILSVHGQLEKGNLENSLKDYMIMYKTPIDILLSGHLHSNKSQNIGIDVEVIQFNSICGADDYGFKIHKTSNAGTRMLILEEGKGKTIDYNISLQHIY